MTPIEHELGCLNGHGVVLRDGRAWCDACGGFVAEPKRTGRTRARHFVLETIGGKVFDRYPRGEAFR